jgi:hypothetical protein
MSAETLLYSTLSGAAAVTAIVSTRIYPDVVPQDATLPCVAFNRIDTVYHTTIHSAVPVAETAILEITCMSSTRVNADALADAVLAAVGAAGYVPSGRRGEIDTENALWASVLTVEYLS